MACYANGNLPVAPMPITAIFPPSANRKKIDSASVSVCTDPPSGLGSYWPWLNQGTAAYITWRYGGNSAINQTTGKWTWSAAFVAPGKGIIFTEKDSSKVGF